MIIEAPNSPGIFDIPNNIYHNGPGISKSGIAQFMKSPLHYYERYLNPDRKAQKQTPEMEFGSAFHIFILEPHLFDRHVAIMPKADGRTKEGKALKDEFKANSIGKIILEVDDYEKLLYMCDRVNAHPQANNLIKNGQYERSLYFNDPESNLLCKSRPDILHRNFIADLKTTNDASFNAFQRAVFTYGYHLQAGLMFDAVEHVLKTKMTEFVFIVVEKEPPYAVAVYPFDELAINYGKEKYKLELLKMAKCFNDNVWPTYENQVISLPQWVFNQQL